MISTRHSLLALPLLVLSVSCGGGGGATTTTEAASESSGDSQATDAVTEPTTTPTSDTSGAAQECGDGIVGEGEVCDGADLTGKSCAEVDAAFIGGTLACAADCGAFDTAKCEQDANVARVVLNEVSAKGASDGPYAGLGDAIELYNAGGAPAQLTGWKLSDDPTFPIAKTYVFPPGVTLAPGAYLVLVTFDAVAATGDFPFGISSTKEETLTLADQDGVTADQLIVAGADAEVSYCRLPDGTGAWQTCDLTLAGTNVAASQTCGDAKIEGSEACDGAELGGATCVSQGFSGGALACTSKCALDPSMCSSGSPVAINELESIDDNVEIYNSGNAVIDVSGWTLTDEASAGSDSYDPVADTKKLVFPAMSTLAAKEFLVVAKGALADQHAFGLGNDGDVVTLLDADLKPVSQVSYGVGEAAVSFCRLPDGPMGAWQADCAPTMGLANKKP